MNHRKHAGFTLIELMIVVSIIAILASIVMPKFSNLIRKSREGASKGNLGSIRSAMSIYYSDMEGQFPSNIASFTIAGKYLAAIPQAFSPDYHPGSSSEKDVVNPALPCSSFNGIWMSLHIDDFATAGWIYCDTLGDSLYGVVSVNCSHTDTKGTLWTNY